MPIQPSRIPCSITSPPSRVLLNVAQAIGDARHRCCRLQFCRGCVCRLFCLLLGAAVCNG
eukprot:10515114-Lingulodinium_polyedra.AAC.1